jgi:transposase
MGNDVELGLELLRHPRKDDGTRAGLRVLVAAWDHMTGERTAAVNALTALLRVLDLGIDARKPLTGTQIGLVSKWRPRAEAVRLAKRVVALDDELDQNSKTMIGLLRQSPARALLDEPGIGPVTAAVAMAAWSHHGRLRSEAAFASLAGVNPIPASSGNTRAPPSQPRRHRRLNQALHMAVVVRMRTDPETRAYVERRTAEGRTTKEIRRSLKRYLARQIHHALTAATRVERTSCDMTRATPSLA